MFEKIKTSEFFRNLKSYIDKCDSLLESHYNLTCPLRQDQKILVLELYANSVVIYKFMKGLLSKNNKDESIKWEAFSGMSVTQEEALKLSEMIKIIIQIVLELENSGIKLGNN